MIFGRTIHHDKIIEENTWKKWKKRCSRIAPLVRIFLGLLQTWSGWKRQKWGRTDREVESEWRRCGKNNGDTGEEHEHKRVNEPRGNQVFINNNILLFAYRFLIYRNDWREVTPLRRVATVISRSVERWPVWASIDIPSSGLWGSCGDVERTLRGGKLWPRGGKVRVRRFYVLYVNAS